MFAGSPVYGVGCRGRCAPVCAVLWVVGAVLAQTSQPRDQVQGWRVVCELQDARITEASGLVASRLNPGCYYVHNDSGDTARVFLVDGAGRTRVEIRLVGVAAADCEDIALAPGPGRGAWDVCLADIGDNSARRPYVAIYRFAEVEARSAAGAAIEVKPQVYLLRYEDGPADAEAFCVDPKSGDGYILTKTLSGRLAVYRLRAPWQAGQIITVARHCTLELPEAPYGSRIVTGADVSPDGRRLAVRCYIDGWEWPLPEGKPFESIFSTRPRLVSLPAEPQPEAICYSADGRVLLTVSEGLNPALYETRLEGQMP
jgi:hypothetical protein